MIKTALQIKTIGNILREKRKELKLEIKQISEITKIRADYLTALEEGNYNAFPSEVYLKGFLKNYAKHLGISTEKALALYRRENERKGGEADLEGLSKDIQHRSFVFTPNKVLIMIAALSILIIILYLSSYIGQVIKTPELEITSPIAFNEEGEVSYRTDANFIEIKGKVQIGSKLKINDTELKLNNFEEFTKKFDLVTGSNVFILSAESQFGRIKTITLSVIKEVSVTPTPTPTPTVDELQLSIEIVNKDTQLTVFIDGEKRTERLYKVGSTLEFTAKNKIELRCSSITSLKVILNDKDEEIDSVISIWELTPEGVIEQ